MLSIRTSLKLFLSLIAFTFLSFSVKAQETILEEGFETGSIPSDWTQEYVSGSVSWSVTSGGMYGNPSSANTGSYNARLYSSSATTRLITEKIEFGMYTKNTQLEFYEARVDWVGDQDELKVYYKSSSTGSWTQLAYYSSESSSWTQRTIDLPNPSDDYYIMFEGIAAYGYGICIDDIEVTGEINAPDLSVSEIMGPEQPIYAGTYDLSAKVEWLDGVEATSFDIHWSVDGTTMGTESWSGSMDANNNEVTIDLGSYDFMYPEDEEYYNDFFVRVWIDNINGMSADGNMNNNDKTMDVHPMMTDAGITQITQPSGNVSVGNSEVKAILKNFGAKPLTSAKIQWAVDGQYQTPYEWTGNLAMNETVEVTLGSYYFDVKVPLSPYTIFAETVDPNGISDEWTDNDKSPVSTVGPPLIPGKYYVGGSNSNFETPEELASYINSSGVSGEGSYIFEFAPGVYETPMSIDLEAPSDDYKFIFVSSTEDPDDVIITMDNAGSGDVLFGFNNMDNIEILGLTFMLSNNNGTLLEFNNSNNLRIFECKFHDANDAIVFNYDGSDTPEIRAADNMFWDLARYGVRTNINPEYDEVMIIVGFNEFTGDGASMSNPVSVINGSSVVFNTFEDFTGSSNMPAIIHTFGNYEGTEIAYNEIMDIENYHGIFVNSAESGDILGNEVEGTSDGTYHALLVETSSINVSRNNLKMSGYGPTMKIFATQGIFSNNMIVGYENSGVMLDDNAYLYFIYNSIQNMSAMNPAVELTHDDSFVMRNIISNIYDAPAISIMNSSGATIDENAYQAKGDVFCSIDGQTFDTFEDWQSNSGQDANSNELEIPFKDDDNLLLVRVYTDLLAKDPVDLPLTEAQREEFEYIDYNEDVRGNYGDFYKGADAITPEVTIRDNPASVMTCEGDTTVVLSVAAVVTYAAELTYQWYVDGVEIEGATNSVYRFDNEPVEYTNSGFYTCLVGARGGAVPVETKAVGVYILTEPNIVKQNFINVTQGNQMEYALEGDIVHLEVESHVRGLTPPYYKDKFQWYFYNSDTDNHVMLSNDNPRLNGAHSSMLTIDGINNDDLNEGNYYYVVIEGLCGTVTSQPFNLYKAPEYVISFNNQPQPVDLCEGGQTVLTVVTQKSEDVDEIQYQWYKDDMMVNDGGAYTGANTNQLTISYITPAEMGEYHLTATTVPGGVTFTTDKAMVTVDPLPIYTMDLDMDTMSVEINNDLNLEVAADYANAYQWYKDGVKLDGETNATLSITITQENQAGLYYCHAINDCGEVPSKSVDVSVITGGQVSVNEAIEQGFMLHNAQPNPVSTDAKLSFTTPNSVNAKLVITDLNGKVIATVFDGITSAGINYVEIDSRNLNLSNGVYYYTLITNKFRLTNKFVVSK